MLYHMTTTFQNTGFQISIHVALTYKRKIQKLLEASSELSKENKKAIN